MRPTSFAAIALLSCFAVGACAASRRGGDDDDDASGEEDCASGYDEDGDHLVDCFDPDCASVPACIPTENCTNLIDDDGDTLVDCDDPSCAAEESCAPDPESNCGDDLDDDGDGDVDCDDSDCAASPACQDPVGGDCDAICQHQEECGVGTAGCLDACECSLDQMLAPEFSSSFYECIGAADCSIFDDPTPCYDQADYSSSNLADELVATCRNRDDCAVMPCEYFGMFNDDTLDTMRTCLQRSDCLTCLEDASTVCPAM